MAAVTVAAGWVETRVEQIAAASPNALATGPFGSSIGSQLFTQSGVPLIRGSNLSEEVDIRLSHDDLVYVSEETAEKFKRSVVTAGDLVFTCWGTIGQVGLIDKRCPHRRYLISNKQMKLTPDPQRADSLFLYYLFSGPELSNRIKNQAIGSSVPGFNLGQLKALRLLLPPLHEQRAIAKMLGSIDDKIELNRRMNQTLEDMAQALFRSWFVDFDPVRAKAEGRQPEGMDAETAALFPGRFVKSELGMSPEGWRVAPLAETCSSIFSGGTPHTQSANYWGGGIPWLSSGETRSRFIIDTEKTITADGVANSSTRLARSGCTVIASAGQGHTRGQASLLTFDSYINQSIVALQADPACSSDLFLFFDLKRRYEQFRQLSDSHSSRGSLTTKLLGELRVLVPPLGLVSRYDAIAGPLVARIKANLHQSRTLSGLRDSLLPKLLSGEIRVREAEAQLAAGV